MERERKEDRQKAEKERREREERRRVEAEAEKKRRASLMITRAMTDYMECKAARVEIAEMKAVVESIRLQHEAEVRTAIKEARERKNREEFAARLHRRRGEAAVLKLQARHRKRAVERRLKVSSTR